MLFETSADGLLLVLLLLVLLLLVLLVLLLLLLLQAPNVTVYISVSIRCHHHALARPIDCRYSLRVAAMETKNNYIVKLHVSVSSDGICHRSHADTPPGGQRRYYIAARVITLPVRGDIRDIGPVHSRKRKLGWFECNPC